jgi:hypothetical protein
MSKASPDFKNKETSFPLIVVAVVIILNAIIRIKVILSFSKSPLFTYLYTWKVKNVIMFLTRFEGNWAFSDRSIDSMNNFKNYSKDELYIQFTNDTSIIVK